MRLMHYRSELVWKQIQYIAELLDDNDLFAWGNIAIGSDYDGLVDPLNSFLREQSEDRRLRRTTCLPLPGRKTQQVEKFI